MTLLAAYDRAFAALAEAALQLSDAKTIGEVMDVKNGVEHIRLYARQLKDKELLAKAVEVELRTERRLGELLEAAKKAGQLVEGRRRKDDTERVTLDEIGIDRKLSSTAQKAASLAVQAFEAVIEAARNRITSRGAIEIVAVDKKERRDQRERELATVQTALPDKRYGVIYADPEWRFEVYNRDTGMDRAADNHYPTSTTDEICKRPVADIAADDCCLFLWATVPMLPDALRVMEAWSFAYKSHCIWAKDRLGTGYWFRNKHEILLVGTRGDIPAPSMGTQFESVIEAPVGRHSEKPERFYELIEAYFPTLPKIELNARRARAGWDCWGKEAPEVAA